MAGRLISYFDPHKRRRMAVGSGIIVYNNYVLTARHCVEDKNTKCRKLIFEVGDINEEPIVYESCDGPFLETLDIDLAVIKIKRQSSDEK